MVARDVVDDRKFEQITTLERKTPQGEKPGEHPEDDTPKTKPIPAAGKPSRPLREDDSPKKPGDDADKPSKPKK